MSCFISVLTNPTSPRCNANSSFKKDLIDIFKFNLLRSVDELLKLEPYGNGFDYPIFKMKAHITSIEVKGKNKDTGIMRVLFGKDEYKATWFKYDQSVMFNKLKKGDYCELAVQVRDNFWKGKRTVSLQVLHANII